MMKKNTFLTICFSFFLAGSLFSQETVYVAAVAAGDANGTSEANAFGSLADGLTAIDSSGDILKIIGAVATPGANLTSKSFAFTIEGTDATATINGDGGTGRLFTINGATSADVTFKDLTFSDNATTLSGGAVYFNNNGGATATFNNCIFSGNSATHNNGGGVIFNNNGTVNVTGCTFTNNTSSDEGGAIAALSGIVTITNSVFETNTAATKGGALYTNNANFTITGTTFYGNKTTGAGGGSALYVAGSGSTNSITNCTFYQNTTANGNQDYGTIRTDNGNTTVSNSLFYDNKTNNGAGGASDWGSGPGGTQTFNNSIAQWISTNIDNQDEGSGSITGIKGGGGTAANLTNSSLAWDPTLKRVTYTAANALTDNTPIDFGSDTEDVGAWDSKINIFKGGATGAVEAFTNTTNWSNGALPSETDNVAILTGGNCTLAGEATINNIKVTSQLNINNNKVLIVNGTSNVTGTLRYFRSLTDDAVLTKAWHLVSSPLSGEVFDVAYADKNDIAANGGNRGIATYNPGSTGAAAWTYFTGTDITASPGQGYSMKITPDAVSGEFTANLISFEGDFNTNNAGVTTSSLPIGFNLVGNPYTSFVNSATFLGAASNDNLDQTQIWLWNPGTAVYEVKTSGDAFVLAPTQGFFVKANSAGTVNFAESNQATTGGAFQKSSRTEVRLLMNEGANNRFAKLYFTENATAGFDTGWEGETFGGITNSVDVFTHLVADSQGKNYQVQSLPKSDLESMVVPVGVRAEAGKEIIFSSENTNVPSDVKVYLEDRAANTFNEIDENTTFKVTLTEDLDGIGRFYLHTSVKALSLENLALDNVSIYKSGKSRLTIAGLTQGKSTVKIFNILGKQILNKTFVSNGVQDIKLPKIATGVYIVQLETEKGKLNKKIILE